MAGEGRREYVEMAEENTNDSERQGPERGRRQVLTGTVVSDKMNKTITVAVESKIMHPLYQRIVKRTAKFAAHDEQNSAREGDRVVIVQSRPMSKRKRWRLREVIERAQ
jgi:small subunit ribosomal protein S17